LLRRGKTGLLRRALAASELERESFRVARVLVHLGRDFGGLGEIGGQRAEGLYFVAERQLANIRSS
jgi:hypothetical protein